MATPSPIIYIRGITKFGTKPARKNISTCFTTTHVSLQQWAV